MTPMVETQLPVIASPRLGRGNPLELRNPYKAKQSEIKMERLVAIPILILGLYSIYAASLMREAKGYDVLKRTRKIVGGVAAIMLGIILFFKQW